jgi:hypothetical protein
MLFPAALGRRTAWQSRLAIGATREHLTIVSKSAAGERRFDTAFMTVLCACLYVEILGNPIAFVTLGMC